MLIVSDTVRTFALVSYDENNWEFPYWYSGYFWSSPIIGYSAGDGLSFETLDVQFWNLNTTIGNTGTEGVWIFPLFVSSGRSPEEECKAWYDRERLEGVVDFVSRSILNSCPCTLEQAQANWRAGWAWGFYYASRPNCTMMWWPRRVGWSWWGSEPIGTVECCYDDMGTLIVGPRNGGTSKKYHHYHEPVQYINSDLIPYRDCCVASSSTELCDYYYQLRRSDDCSLYDEALGKSNINCVCFCLHIHASYHYKLFSSPLQPKTGETRILIHLMDWDTPSMERVNSGLFKRQTTPSVYKSASLQLSTEQLLSSLLLQYSLMVVLLQMYTLKTMLPL